MFVFIVLSICFILIYKEITKHYECPRKTIVAKIWAGDMVQKVGVPAFGLKHHPNWPLWNTLVILALGSWQQDD